MRLENHRRDPMRKISLFAPLTGWKNRRKPLQTVPRDSLRKATSARTR